MNSLLISPFFCRLFNRTLAINAILAIDEKGIVPKFLQSSNNFANSLGKSVGESACKKVHGFKELQCSPDQPFSTIDSYGFTQGKPGCNGAGYFNSKGDLCLDEKQLNELHNRGGNDIKSSTVGA